MRLYRDLCTEEEVFTDTIKHKFTDDGYIIEVESKMEQESSDVGDINIGANASAEEAEEHLEAGDVKSGLDIVLRSKLEDVSTLFPSKKDLLTYAKKHVKNVADKLKQEDGDKAKKFMDDSKTKFKTFVDKWNKEASVYTVGNDKFDPEDGKATLMICVWNEDGMGAKFYLLADALESLKL